MIELILNPQATKIKTLVSHRSYSIPEHGMLRQFLMDIKASFARYVGMETRSCKLLEDQIEQIEKYERDYNDAEYRKYSTLQKDR